MDKIRDFKERNPDFLVKQLGERLRVLRLAAGWTQSELAERAGVSLSTLKLLEQTGKGSLQRVAKIAVVLNVDAELRQLFQTPRVWESREAISRSQRKRAPRSKKGGKK